MDDLGIS